MKHTRRKRKISGRNHEQGIVVMLVAVFMLFVVGAMAALSIDVVTLYTARSEAQLAADAAALAAARVLANSGMTSDTTGGLVSNAQILASNVATQVATRNEVGGRRLNANNGEVNVSFNFTTFTTNPHVTVTVQRTDLPTFFARMWGWTQIAVAASATAEAYNPSSATSFGRSANIPVAPMCVKPWLLPNIDPSNSPKPIFDSNTGAIDTTSLLGWPSSSTSMSRATLPSTPTAWQYYPGDPTSFFPSQAQVALPACAAAFTTYQQSVAGCVQTPISCSSTAYVLIAPVPPTGLDTADAVNCLTNATNGGGDTLTTTNPPTVPFQFVAGTNNLIAVANPSLAGQDVMVSDSLVTVPVFDSSGNQPVSPGSQVAIIGFVQLFLNPTGAALPSNTDTVSATVINMAGCGRNAFGMGSQTPILGNGASPVAVRLITPP